jgi:hypothetical protein
MTEYLVVKPLLLGFMNDRDQYDCNIDAGSVIGWKNRSIYLMVDGHWRESITALHSLTIWLNNGSIIENL